MNKDTPMCKAKVWPAGAWHSVACSRKAKQDGFCGVHHPDAKKRRDDKRKAHWEKQQAASPYTRIQTLERELSEAQERIKELEGILTKLLDAGHLHDNNDGLLVFSGNRVEYSSAHANARTALEKSHANT